MRLRVVLLACVLACAPPPRGAAPDYAPDPEEEGEFPVGVTTVDLYDMERGDVDTGRPLRVEVWYPAAPESIKLPRDVIRYDDEAPAEVRAKIAELGIELEQDAARDAEPELRAGPYPLVVFSHGNFGIRHQSVFLTRHWASHGYVVAAVDHAGNTLWDALLGADAGDIAGSMIERPKDVAFVRQEIAGGRAGARLQGLVDGGRVAVSGHSFGGFTALACAHQDKSWDAVIPLAPAYAPLDVIGVDLSALSGGVAVFGGTDDSVTPYPAEQVALYQALAAAPKLLVGLKHGGHFTFSDVCALPLERIASLIDVDVGNVLDDGCGPQFIAPARAQALINRYSTAWLNWRLRGSDGSRAFLEAAPPEDVELQAALE